MKHNPFRHLQGKEPPPINSNLEKLIQKFEKLTPEERHHKLQSYFALMAIEGDLGFDNKLLLLQVLIKSAEVSVKFQEVRSDGELFPVTEGLPEIHREIKSNPPACTKGNGGSTSKIPKKRGRNVG